MPSVQPFSTSVGVITVSRAGNFIRPTCAKLPPQSAFFFCGNRILNQSFQLVMQRQSFWHHHSGCIHYAHFSLHTTRRRYRWVESGKPQNWCLGPRSKGKGWAGNYFLSSSPPQPNRGPHASRFPWDPITPTFVCPQKLIFNYGCKKIFDYPPKNSIPCHLVATVNEKRH